MARPAWSRIGRRGRCWTAGTGRSASAVHRSPCREGRAAGACWCARNIVTLHLVQQASIAQSIWWRLGYEIPTTRTPRSGPGSACQLCGLCAVFGVGILAGCRGSGCLGHPRLPHASGRCVTPLRQQSQWWSQLASAGAGGGELAPVTWADRPSAGDLTLPPASRRPAIPSPAPRPGRQSRPGPARAAPRTG